MSKYLRLSPVAVAGLISLPVLAAPHSFGHVFGFDVYAFIHAARVGQTAGWSHIYDPGQQVDLAANRWFISPPLVAWLALPLVPLSDAWATALWLVASLAAVAAVVRMTVPRWSLLPVSALVLFSLVLGQVIAFTLLMLAACLRWHRSRPWLAGLALAIAFQLKPNLLLLVPVALAGARAWKMLGVFGLASAAIGAAYLLVLGPHFISSYLSLVHTVDATAINPVAWALAAALALFLGVWQSDPMRALSSGLLVALLLPGYQHPQDEVLAVFALWTAAEARPAQTAFCVVGALGTVLGFEVAEAGRLGMLLLGIRRRVPSRAGRLMPAERAQLVHRYTGTP